MLNQEFPSHYIYSVYNRSSFLVFYQDTQDVVGGMNATMRTMPTRIEFNYDEYAIYITLKLINKIDRRETDVYDFGSTFLNKMSSIIFGVDFTP
jgi:hypothetical protein